MILDGFSCAEGSGGVTLSFMDKVMLREEPRTAFGGVTTILVFLTGLPVLFSPSVVILSCDFVLTCLKVSSDRT